MPRKPSRRAGGRPRQYDVTTTVQLTHAQHDALRSISAVTGTPIGALIRRGIDGVIRTHTRNNERGAA